MGRSWIDFDVMASPDIGRPYPLEKAGATVSMQADKPLPLGRSKYTCTAPHPSIRQAYYWHTQLWIKPLRDGSWYEG